MDKFNAASLSLVAALVAAVAINTAVDHRGLNSHAPHPASPSSTAPAGPPAKASLTTTLAFRVDGDTTTRETTYSFIATNFSTSAVTITSIGASRPGLQLLRATADPMTVQPQGRTTVSARFRVTDCTKVTRSAWPLPITFTSAGTESTQLLDLGGTSPETPWQVTAAEAVCRPQSVTP